MLANNNSSTGMQSSGTLIESGSTAQVLTVTYASSSSDSWFLVCHVVNGSHSGTYVSGSGTITNPKWASVNIPSSESGKRWRSE
jgi:hypothetical protein